MPSLLDLTPTQTPVQSTDIHGMIDELSAQYGVDPDLVRGVVQVESGFNPIAKASTSSAKGLMQLVDGTAKMMGVQDAYNPRQNLEGGIKYLKQQLDASGGDVSKALAMYNQGPAGDLSKAQDYVAKVRSNYKGKNWGAAPMATPSTSGRSLFDLGGEVPAEGAPSVQPTQVASKDEGQAWPVATHIIDYIHRNLPRYKEGWEQAKAGADRPFMPGFDEFVQRAGDLALGTVEAPVGLASGAVGFFTGAGASAPKAVSSFAHPGGVWAGLSEAKDTLDKVSEGSMWQPSTKTGRAPLEAISGVFGEAHNFIADTWKEHFAEGLSPEELDKRIKGTQYLFDVATLGLGLGKGKAKGKVSDIRPRVNTPEGVTPADVAPMASHEVSPTEVAALMEQIPDAPKEAVDVIKMVADKATKEKVKKEKKGEVDVEAEPKLTLEEEIAAERARREAEVIKSDPGEVDPFNTSIEAPPPGYYKLGEQLYDATTGEKVDQAGSVKTTPQTPEAIASTIDPNLRYDGVTAGIPGVVEDLHGFTVKLEDGREPPFSVMGDVTPEKVQSALEGVKEKFEPNVEEVPEGITLPTVEQLDAIEPKEVPVKQYTYTNNYVSNADGSPATFYHGTSVDIKGKLDPYQSNFGLFGTGTYLTDNAGVASSYTKKGKGKNPQVLPVNIEIRNPIDMDAIGDIGTWKDLWNEYLDEPIPEGKTNEYYFKELVDTFNGEQIHGAEVGEIFSDYLESKGFDGITHVGGLRVGSGPKHRVYIVFHPEQIKSVFEAKPKAYLPISEFDSITLAQDEGYSFPIKKRYATMKDAQAKALSIGEGHEVVKVGEKYRVAKFTETEILPFDSPEAASAAGWDLMSEISERQAKAETPEKGFAIGKVGDSYYRLSKHEEMPREAVVESLREPSLEDFGLDMMDEDGVSAEDWAALREFDRDGTLNRTLSEQKNTLDQLMAQMKELDVHPQAKADRVPELMGAYEKWREGYVTKSNVERTYLDIPITSKLSTVSTLGEALNQIKSDIDPVRQHIVDKLLPHVKDAEFKLALDISEASDLKLNSKGEITSYGASLHDLSSDYSKVIIAGETLKGVKNDITPASIVSTTIHEAIHVATIRKLNKGIKDSNEGNWTSERSFYRGISDLMDIVSNEDIPSHIKNDPAMKAAIIHEAEFIAEGLSNPVFIEFLKSVKTESKSAYSKFVDLIRNILGIPSKESNAFISLVDLTNEALSSKAKSKPIKSENLGIVDPSFTPHDTFEAAQKFKEDLGLEGDVIGPDPKTGKYYIYDSMADLDSAHWEREVLEGDVDSVVEQYGRADKWSEPELSESGGMGMWDILSNERGAIKIPGLEYKTHNEVFKDKLKGVFIDREKGDTTITHPAVYSERFIPIFAEIAKKYDAKTVLDPFGGVGNIGKIKDYGFEGKVIANELEAEWSAFHESNKVDESITGDARKMPSIESDSIDAVITSPTYGNRLADRRITAKVDNLTYANSLGRELTSGNSGRMHYGPKYKQLHNEVYKELYRVVKPGGIAVINMKDFISKGKVVPVTDFHINAMLNAGFELLYRDKVKTTGLATGKIKRPKVESEDIIVFEKPSKGIFEGLFNERGSVELPQYDLQTLRNLRTHLGRLEAAAESLGVNMATYLKDKFNLDGVTLENTLALLKAHQNGEIDNRIRELDPKMEEIFNPTSPILSQKVTKKEKAKFVAFTENMRDWVKARDVDNSWGKSVLSRYGELTEISLGQLERYGAEDLYYLMAEQDRKRSDWVDGIIKETKENTKDLSARELHDVNVYMMALQDGVGKMLIEQGVKIPEMNDRQIKFIHWFRKTYDKIYDMDNYARTNIGLAPLKYEKDYLTIQRIVNKAAEEGTLKTFRAKNSTMAEQVRDFKANFNQYALDRAKNSKLPIKFALLDGHYKYINTMSHEIFTAPVAGYVHSLATGKWKEQRGFYKKGDKQGSPRYKTYSMRKINPDLHNILVRWSDDILGKDIASPIYQKYPAVKKGINWLRNGIVEAYIIGSTGVAIKQFGALVGAGAITGLYLPWGIARAMVEKPATLYKGTLTRAREKSNILNIRGYGDPALALGELWVQGKISASRAAANKVLGSVLSAVDGFVAESSWNAFYDYAKKHKKMSDADAFKFAERSTVYTQGVGKRWAASPIQNIPGLGLATMLQNFAITDFNFLLKDVLGVKNPNRFKGAHVRMAMRYLIGAYLFNTALQAIGMQPEFPAPIQTWQDSIDEGDSEVKAGGKVLLNSIQRLPIVGGSVRYESSLGGIFGQFLTDAPAAFKQAIELADWQNMSEAELLNHMLKVGKVAGVVLRVPMTNQIVKSIKAGAHDAEPWEVLIGVYDKELQRQGRGGLPKLQGLPSLPKL